MSRSLVLTSVQKKPSQQPKNITPNSVCVRVCMCVPVFKSMSKRFVHVLYFVHAFESVITHACWQRSMEQQVRSVCVGPGLGHLNNNVNGLMW